MAHHYHVEISPTFEVLSYIAIVWLFLLWSAMVIRMIVAEVNEMNDIDVVQVKHKHVKKET